MRYYLSVARQSRSVEGLYNNLNIQEGFALFISNGKYI